MSTNLWKSFISAVVSVTLLAGLGAGLIWLFSSAMPQAAPQRVEASPSPAPTSEPIASPTPVPLQPVETREQIIAALNALAESDTAAYQGALWAHRVYQNLNEEGSGAILTAYWEEWVHIVDGQCREMMSISRDRPDGEKLYNLFIGLPDGTYGDLIELRDGREVGPGSLRTDWRCAVLASDTDAGILAGRLKTGAEQVQVKGPNEVKDLSARFETLDGRPVLVVNATFTGAGNIPEVQRVEQRFEVETGRMYMEKTVAEWEDGRPFSEVSRNQMVEFRDALPSDVAELFAASSAELLTYLDPSAHPTATTFPTSEPRFLDGLTAFTVNAPLTQPTTIQQALQALLQRHTEWINQPGWVLHHPRPMQDKKWDMTYSVLMHILPDGSCEQMTYYVKDGRILPQQINLPNGDWGLTGDVQAGVFTEGKAGEQPCHAEDYHTIGLLTATLDFVNSVVAGNGHQTLQLWVDERQNGPTVVLYSDETYTDPQPMVQDPDSGKLEPQMRSQMWTFFDLQTGAFLGANNLIHLASGKVFGDSYQPGGAIELETLRYASLPANLAEAFEQTRATLAKYLTPKP